MSSKLVIATALMLAATAAHANTLPQSYHGDWCFVMRVQNGHDALTGKRIPNNMFYRRVDRTADCEEDFISIDASRKSYSTYDGKCRILRVRKFPDGYRVTYNCDDDGITRRMTISRDGDDLSIEQ